MSATYSSSISTSTSTSQEGTDGTATLTYDETVALYVGDLSAGSSSGTMLLLQGDATALGDATLASASVYASVSSGSAIIQAEFNAAAMSADEGLAYAATYLTAEVGGDFDHLISFSNTSTGSSTSGGIATVTASASIEVYAFDTDASWFGMEAEAVPIQPSVAELPSEACECDSGPDAHLLDGNVALFDVVAIAEGEDSYLDLGTFAIALDQQLSEVTITLLAEAG